MFDLKLRKVMAWTVILIILIIHTIEQNVAQNKTFAISI